jgi:5'-nucleotidase
MRERQLVLVTNDDGIESEGLRSLARSLNDLFDVIVAAPAADMSGAGTGIGRFDHAAGVELTPIDLDFADKGFSLDGPPGLAVTAAALGAFGEIPDLVFSGINQGINTGHSIIHSGTVGAALTANTFDMKGVAISLAKSDPWQFGTAAHVAPSIASWITSVENGPSVLNVNVPGLPLDEVRGVHWADLDEFGYFNVATADPQGGRLSFVVGPRVDRSDPASDTVLCAEGFVTITPLRTVEPATFPAVEARELVKLPIEVSS